MTPDEHLEEQRRSLRNAPYSEQLRIIGKKWVQADYEASLLEELKSATLEQMKARIIGDDPSMSVNRAEMIVKAGAEWTEYINTMCATRRDANMLKLQVEHIREKSKEQQSAEATRRAEMRL